MAAHVFNDWLKRKTTRHPDRTRLRVPFMVAAHYPCYPYQRRGWLRHPDHDRGAEPFVITKRADGSWHHQDCQANHAESAPWWVLGEIHA